MKRSAKLMGLMTLFALPMVATSVATAQSARSIGFGVSGGLSQPIGDLGDRTKSGYSVAGHVYLAPTTMPRLNFRGDLSYDAWDASDSFVTIDKSRNVAALTGNALLRLGESTSMARPYLLGGLGAYRSQRTFYPLGAGTATTTVSASSTNVGIQGGGGLDFNLSGFSTFLEAKYVNVFTDGYSHSYVPITFGVRF